MKVLIGEFALCPFGMLDLGGGGGGGMPISPL